MQTANVDSVDIVFWIFFPPIGALIIYACAYGAARSVAGGHPVSRFSKRIAFYGAIVGLGIGYLEAISLVVFKLPDIAQWASGALWVALVLCFALWRARKVKESGDTSPRTR
jgi:hypothetical protein